MEAGLDLTGIAVVAGAATLCGTLMTRLKQPAIVGYILAGILLGPSGLQLITDREQVGELAELGVLLLLYFVGMELSLRNFRRAWRIAVFSALIQISVSVGIVLGLTRFFGWPASHAVLFGFVLALSSTAVAIRMLDEIGELRTRVGRITVGILVAQDLAVAPMLFVVSALAGDSDVSAVIFKITLSVALLAGATIYLSRRRKINLPLAAVTAGGMDLTPVAALTWCFGFAAIAGLIGLSPAFGAFFAGLLVSSSQQRQMVAESAHPIQSVLLMVFFLSIGLLIDLEFLWKNIGAVILVWLFVAGFKTVLNTLVLRAMGEPTQRAFLSSLVLAQLGEFSFVLGAAAIDRSVIDSEIHRMIVAVTVLSLVTSPLWLSAARRLHHRAAQRPGSLRKLLRLIYFREWRITRRISGTVAASAVAVVQGLVSGSGETSAVKTDKPEESAEKQEEPADKEPTETESAAPPAPCAPESGKDNA